VSVLDDRRPFDPEAAARAAGVEVLDWSTDIGYLGLYLREAGVGVIGLHPRLAEPVRLPLRRVVICHELAHHHIHVGVHVPLVGCRSDRLRTAHVEAQAERWAGEMLLPPRLVAAVGAERGRLGQEELAELADWARVPARWAAWWARDAELRGLFRAPVFR
jgi:IrrE N-terminal-like domain